MAAPAAVDEEFWGAIVLRVRCCGRIGKGDF